MKIQVKGTVLLTNDNNEPMLEYNIDATCFDFEQLVALILNAGAQLNAALDGPKLEPEIVEVMRKRA